MKRFLIIACAALFLGSCVDNPDLPHGMAVTGDLKTVLSVSGDPALAGTRSGLTVADDGLDHVDVFFYESGSLCESLTISEDAGWNNTFTTRVSLPVGHTFDILVLANAGDVTPAATYTEAVAGLTYVCDGLEDWNRQGLPMAGMTSVTVRPNMGDILVDLTRLVAKLRLSIDISSLQHGSIEFYSIKVRQMNRVCPFYADGMAASPADVCDGDIASSADLAGLNADGSGGYSADFYLLENLQGVLLPGNTNPDSKNPDRLRAVGANPALCTYLEVLGSYSGSSGQVTGEPLTARCYLGGNAFSDFNLARNHSYAVTLSITDEGCLRTDWKMDGNLDDRRQLAFASSHSTVYPGASVTASLNTNLSHSAGDYSYSMSGDISLFDVVAGSDATEFTVTASGSAPVGASVTISAATWDGHHNTAHTVTVRRPPSDDYRFERTDGSGVIYVAQSAMLRITDLTTGGYPSGTVSVISRNGHCSVEKYGTRYWYADARSEGDEVLELWVDGEMVGTLAMTVVAPVLRFDSEAAFLPVDGSLVNFSPSYYEPDGTYLDYDEFDAVLYEELLNVNIVRSTETYMLGTYWQRDDSGGNPAVGAWQTGEEECRSYAFAIRRLSCSGTSLSQNYDMRASRVVLERITAWPEDTECGVLPATALLYTSEPFGSECDLGTQESWALAHWYMEDEHDETFTFDLDDLVLPGNNYRYAGVEYPYSTEGKYEFRFNSRNEMQMTVLYEDNVETAMPEHYFIMFPIMRNFRSSEVYRSIYQYEAEFTVNLGVGGVAEDNNAGGCNVSLEWSFPRIDEGRLQYIEDHALGSLCDGSGFEKGMYRRLYSAYGYSPEEYMEAYYPDYGFCRLDGPSGSAGLITASSYHVPLAYAGGYDLVLWKYDRLYPETNGWLAQ